MGSRRARSVYLTTRLLGRLSPLKLLTSIVHIPSPELIVLGFNDMSTLEGHFVSSPREREKRDRRRVEEMKERDREERGTGMKVKKQKK